jgi:AcrR family transcriptional regulator
MSNELPDPPKRRYRLNARAQSQQETRDRIAAATAELHQEVGPARTTITEVARRAGVQRPTVYNNFPEDRELFAACQAHFLAQHPPPDPSAALMLDDPAQRLHAALVAFYAWYRETEAMAGNVQRDRHLLPELDAVLQETADPALAALADELARGFRLRGRTAVRTRAVVGLALAFPTWQQLIADGLTDAEAANLMVAATVAASRPAGGQVASHGAGVSRA